MSKAPRKLRVPLGARSYDIVVGDRLLLRAGALIRPRIRSDVALIVTDETVARLYLHRLTGSLEDSGIRSRCVIVPPGEASKSLRRFGALAESLLECAPDRQTAVIALGGGVVGDLAGFAASVLLRGIDFIQIPTTLLAQVDSAVGGKTGINSVRGKNLLGTFHQPSLVLSDTSVLATLPERERLAGYAEIVKYGLIDDPRFFAWLEKNGKAVIAGKSPAAGQAILTSCKAKARIVAADERETSGQRALLNLGHTFAHALEAETGYGNRLLHGEAVAIGLVMALKLSVDMGLCPPADLLRVKGHLRSVGLPVSPLAIRRRWNIDRLLGHIAQDKKAKNGQCTLILMRGIGQAFVREGVDPARIRRILTQCCTQD